MTAHDLFLKHYDQITNEIPFNPLWNNGTGYYDGAVEGGNCPVLKAGEMAKCISDSPNCRHIIIVGTVLGNVVVFERFTGGQSEVLTYNCSMSMSSTGLIHSSGALSFCDVSLILGDGDKFQSSNNIGILLGKITHALNRQTVAENLIN